MTTTSFVFWLYLGGLGVFLCFFSIFVTAGLMFLFGAPWVPTDNRTVRELLDFAQLSSTDVLVDLGSGHGVIPYIAMAEYGIHKAYGLEIHPGLVFVSRLRARFLRSTHRPTYLQANLHTCTFPEATVITCYLLPELMTALIPRLCEAYPPETRIISRDFAFAGIEPKHEIKAKKGRFLEYTISQLR